MSVPREPGDTCNTWKIGGYWGNHISWFWDDQFKKPMPEKGYRIYGHKPRRPKVGDILVAEFQKAGTVRFRITEVELRSNPKDMFFGRVVLMEDQWGPE